MLGPSTTNSHGYPNSRNPLNRSYTSNQDLNSASNMIEIEDNDNQIQQNEDLPLKGLVVYVEIFTNGTNISETSYNYLNNLGAKVEKRLTKKCNLVIWKDGSMKTIEKAKQNKTTIVNSLWLENCIENFHCASFDKYSPEITSDMAFPINVQKKQKNKRKAQDTFTPQTFLNTLPQNEENKQCTPFKQTKVTSAEEYGNKNSYKKENNDFGGIFNFNHSQSLPVWGTSKEADFEKFVYNKPEKRRFSSSSQRIGDSDRKSVSKIDYSQPVSLKKNPGYSSFRNTKEDSWKVKTILEKYTDKNKSFTQCISSEKKSKNGICSSELWKQESGFQGFNNEEEFVMKSENQRKQQQEDNFGRFDSWTCVEINKKEEFIHKDVSYGDVKVSQKKEKGKTSAKKVNKKATKVQRSPVISPQRSQKNTQDTEDEAEMDGIENGILFMNISKEDIEKCKAFCEKFGFTYLEDTIMNASKSEYLVCPEGRLPKNYKTAFGILKDKPIINLNWIMKTQGKLQDFERYRFEYNKETSKETRFFIDKEFELLPKNMLRKKELSVLIEGTGGEVTENFRNCDFYVTRRPSEVKTKLPAHVKMIMPQVIIDSICAGKRPNLKN